MEKKVLLMVVVLLTGNIVFAAPNYYVQGGNDFWTTSANWTDGAVNAVPDSTSNVYFVGWGKSAGGSEVCSLTTNAMVNSWESHNTSQITSILNISGSGSLTTTTTMYMSLYDIDAVTIVNVADNASLNVGGLLEVTSQGTSTLNISGNGMVTAYDTWVASWNAGSSGHIQISDNGTFKALNTFYMDLTSGSMDSTLDITDNGKLIVPVASQGYIEGTAIALGKMTANGLTGLDKFSVTSDGTWVTYQVVPEPITMILLSIGGLFISRRK